MIALAPEPPRIVALAETAKSVAYFVLCCPACGSRNVSTSKVVPPIRRHKCRDCSHAFKSVEKVFSG